MPDIIVNILSILVPVLIIAFLIFIHEFGHFIAAKLVGVKVDKFAIGFGPKLWARKWGETEYSFRLIFFGGYVQMHGDMDPSSTKKDMSTVNDPRSFLSKSLSQKIFVLSAGVIMNFLVGVVAFSMYLGFVAGVVGLQKIGNYKFIGAKEYPNLIILSDEFRTKEVTGKDGKIDTGFILTINGQIPDSRKEFISILQNNYNKSVDLELFDGKKISKANVVVNGDGIASNFDLDVFPEVATKNASRPFIARIDGDKGVFRQGMLSDSKKLVSDVKGDLEGSYIISFAAEPMFVPEDLDRLVNANLGKQVEIKLLDKNAELQTVLVTLPEIRKEKEPVLGVGLLYLDMGFAEDKFAFRYGNPISGGIYHTINIVGYQSYALGSLIGDAVNGEPKQLTDNVGGVIAIGDQIGQVVDAAATIDKNILLELFNVTGTISVVLAFMNILPIPVLDGGHILFAIIEKLRGKPLNPRVQDAIFMVFLVLLIGLSILVTLKDVVSLF